MGLKVQSSAIAVLLGLVIGFPAGPACQQVTEQTEAQRKKLEEQQRIKAYSDGVARVDGLQKKFTDSWKLANEQTNIKDLKDAFDTKVLPALDAYVLALKNMPTSSAELAQVHGILVSAYGAAQNAFKGFSSGLTEDNIIERHKGLLASTDAIHTAEKRYYAALKAYYEKFNVTLLTTGERSPGSANASKGAPSRGAKAASSAGADGP